MAKSLADLRAEKRDDRPERSLTICLAQKLVAEVQALTDELQVVLLRSGSQGVEQDADEDKDERPRKMAETAADLQARMDPPRAVEIRVRLGELFDEMAEYEGELRLRANRTDGEWRRWVNDHPAREAGKPGHDRDREIAAGYCNADDLLDDLGTYAHTWNSEPLTPGDWDVLGVSGADKKQAAKAVVHMYELGVNLPKWRSDWLGSLLNAIDSPSPEPSESVPVA